MINSTCWVLWNEANDKIAVRLFFETEAKALAHKKAITDAYKAKDVERDWRPKEIPHPLNGIKPGHPGDKEDSP